MINFIKNLSQLITGGIGIVDDELVYKDSEGNVKTAGGEFETVAEIPSSLDPGQIVLVTDPLAYGLWRGLKEGESGEDEGTPFPLKGYKEVVYWADVNTFSEDVIGEKILKNEFDGLTIAPLDPPNTISVSYDGIDFSEEPFYLSVARVNSTNTVITYRTGFFNGDLNIIIQEVSSSEKIMISIRIYPDE